MSASVLAHRLLPRSPGGRGAGKQSIMQGKGGGREGQWGRYAHSKMEKETLENSRPVFNADWQRKSGREI